MEKLKEFLKKDRFASYNGIELIKCSPGYAKVQVKVEEKHLNSAGIVHGGLIFTLADYAFAAAVNGHGIITLSVNASISYFEKSFYGLLTAEAKEISRSKKLSNCNIDVTDGQNKLIDNFRGTAYITNVEIK
jgi:acyl-CoA thioesterase